MKYLSKTKSADLCPEVGNGKTALILALIALTRHNEPQADSPELVKNKKFIRSRATLVMLPPNLCLWFQMIFDSKVGSGLDKDSFSDFFRFLVINQVRKVMPSKFKF